MGKVHNVNIDNFAGFVEFPDFLTYPQLARVEAAVKEVQENGERTRTNEKGEDVFVYDFTQAHLLFLPVLFDIVKKWSVTNIPETPTLDTFPATPRESLVPLVEGMIQFLLKMRYKEVTVPNE
jgi:hypothetical protein